MGVHPGWPPAQLVQWLRMQGGVSDDGIESLENMGVDGQIWYGATEADWRIDELGLEEADIVRLVELKELQEKLLKAAAESDAAEAAAEQARQEAAELED